MVLTTTATAVSVTLPILKLSYKSIEAINAACADKKLPPAFNMPVSDRIINLSNVNIQGNPDYRFEGFGVDVGVPLKLSFWVHYKPNSPNHIAVGKILVPIQFGEVFDLPETLSQVIS